MLNSSHSPVSLRLLILACVLLLACPFVLAQSTVGTGSIQGLVTDQSGAVLANAKITITNKATAAAIHLNTSSAGAYSSGAIQPGNYVVRVEAHGFQSVETPVTVEVGNTATVSPKLPIGQESQVIEVQESRSRLTRNRLPCKVCLMSIRFKIFL